MPQLVTLGETFTVMVPNQSGPLRYVQSFYKVVGGAESNVAIAVSRLGHTAGWISRLGKDEFGAFIYNFLRGEGVDVSKALFVETAFTGVNFKEIREGENSRNYAYRRLSAASQMNPNDLDPKYIQSAKILHVTGITPALSDSCCAAVFAAMDIARSAGVTISFDPNIRLKLWCLETARPILHKMAESCDIFLPGAKELTQMYPDQSTENVVDKLMNKGVKKVVIKNGDKGCRIYSTQGIQDIPAFEVRCVDSIGAGDGFVAGFLVGQLRGLNDYKSGEIANAVGGLAVTVLGDIEGYPTQEELDNFIRKHPIVDR
mgnify:CR=1 FL=1